MASTTTTTTTTTMAKNSIPMNLTITSSMTQRTALAVDIPPTQYVADEPASRNQKRVYPPSPHRAFSDPLPLPWPRKHISNILVQSADKSPKSVGHNRKSPKNLKAGRGEGTSPTALVGGRRKDTVKRRHSHESRMNVHTSCGRHSDDWLFGGFSVAEIVKKFWEKKE